MLWAHRKTPVSEQSECQQTALARAFISEDSNIACTAGVTERPAGGPSLEVRFPGHPYVGQPSGSLVIVREPSALTLIVPAPARFNCS